MCVSVCVTEKEWRLSRLTCTCNFPSLERQSLTLMRPLAGSDTKPSSATLKMRILDTLRRLAPSAVRCAQRGGIASRQAERSLVARARDDALSIDRPLTSTSTNELIEK